MIQEHWARAITIQEIYRAPKGTPLTRPGDTGRPAGCMTVKYRVVREKPVKVTSKDDPILFLLFNQLLPYFAGPGLFFFHWYGKTFGRFPPFLRTGLILGRHPFPFVWKAVRLIRLFSLDQAYTSLPCCANPTGYLPGSWEYCFESLFDGMSFSKEAVSRISLFSLDQACTLRPFSSILMESC